MKKTNKVASQREVNAQAKRIQNLVRSNCPYIFDDPQTGQTNACSLRDCHCIDMDSPYSFIEKGYHICKVMIQFNQAGQLKRTCAYCQKPFSVQNNSSRQKYCCTACAASARRQKDAARKRNK